MSGVDDGIVSATVSATISAMMSAMVSATTTSAMMMSATISATTSATISDCGGLHFSASVVPHSSEHNYIVRLNRGKSPRRIKIFLSAIPSPCGCLVLLDLALNILYYI